MPEKRRQVANGSDSRAKTGHTGKKQQHNRADTSKKMIFKRKMRARFGNSSVSGKQRSERDDKNARARRQKEARSAKWSLIAAHTASGAKETRGASSNETKNGY